MTAAEVVTLLRSLHRPTTWSWKYDDGVAIWRSKEGCATCGGGRPYGQVSWPCETAALLDSIEQTLTS